ncbi:MAG: hypothetical protein IJH34_02960, partial [Romboutsia sp.]|nr:hypothetical protein [Romboutsia sp.]
MNISKNNIKKKRIKIKDINDFYNALKDEGYKEDILSLKKVNKDENLLKYLSDDITYTAKNVKDILD